MQPTSSFLTQNEKDILKACHRQERDKRLCERQRGLNLNYTGKACKLNQEQLDQLKTYVSKEIPSSAEQVVNFIKKHFAIRYTLSAVISLLHRLNFEYKKPINNYKGCCQDLECL